MSCSRRFEVEALRDGRLSGAELASFERHLGTCAECTEERAAIDALAARVRDPAAVDEVRVARERRRLLTSFEEAVVGPPRGARRPWLLAPALALAVAGALYARPRPPPASPPAPVARSVVVQSEPAAGEVAFTQRQEPGREVVDLKAGTLRIAVDHATHPKPLVITLPDGELEDIGTVFTITVRNGATSEVRVEEGSVVLRLVSSASPIQLTAGQSWTARLAAPAAPSASAAPARAAARPAAGADPAPEYRAALALFDGGDYVAAAPKLARFASEHPDHVHGEDAAYLRVIALQRAGDRDGMQAAASDYLRAYPNGFRHRDVERLGRDATPRTP